MDPLGRPRFFGIYRGIVADINDPLSKKRIRAKVPQVLGTETTGWADACLPVAATMQHGPTGTETTLTTSTLVDGTNDSAHSHTVTLHVHEIVPKVGQAVWIMFEAGDPDHPVWLGVLG
jgi:hypothetical protein